MSQMLSNLPVGAKVKFGKYSVNGETAQPITWLVVAKNHSCVPAYPTNSVTLITEKIIDLRCFDANEPYSTENGVNGLAKYESSNIRQWLNSDKEGGQWYVAQHTYDQPPSENNTTSGTPYENRPGFLNAFTDYEKNAILNTTLRTRDYNGGAIETTDRVFLASLTEINNFQGNADGAEGALFSYFANNPVLTSLTQQAYSYSLSENKPNNTDTNYPWWSRTSSYNANDKRDMVYVLSPMSSGGTGEHPYNGSIGVRPTLNLSSAVSISDTTDIDGCYVTIFNLAPNTPSLINVPTIHGGKTNAISWSVASDPNENTVTYQLECSINEGDYVQIYSGTSPSYAHLVPFGTNSVAYRVKATDSLGESSEYRTSDTITVINNNAPIISGVDSNLGIKSDEFTGTYTITDANENIVTVTESIDGIQIRSFVATLGEEITYGVTENTWLSLANGSHTLTIRATDGIDTTVRTLVFTKLVDKFTIRNSTPWVSSTMPTRIMLVITRNIPSAATFKVEVCNNGFDASPTWEDATDAVKSGLVHVMTNTRKTAANWGILVKVTVERNGATGACYVSAIGGNFE